MTEQNAVNREVYRLTFDHYIDTGKDHIRLDEPLVVQMVFNPFVPRPVCLNNMLDMMRDEIIQRLGRC